jgi:hypothetical protein
MPKLIEMNIEETSGVDHPAHLREGWLVMKATDAAEATELLDAIRAAAQPTNPEEYPMEDQVPEVEAAPVDELAKANERIAELEAALAAVEVPAIEETADDTVDEDLLKSVPEAVRKMLDDQAAAVSNALAKAAASEDELRKERAIRADEAAIAKAAAWTSLSIDAAEVGPMLRKMAEVDADLAAAVETVLSAANAQAESAGIFAEIGKAGRPESTDAYETLEGLAKSAVEAGLSPTFEQAFVKVAEQNPDLYVRHLNEKGA